MNTQTKRQLDELSKSNVSRSVLEECINIIHFLTDKKHEGDCAFTDKADEGCYLCSEAETRMWPRIEKIITLAQAELKRTEPQKEGDEIKYGGTKICYGCHRIVSRCICKPATPEPSDPTPVGGNARNLLDHLATSINWKLPVAAWPSSGWQRDLIELCQKLDKELSAPTPNAEEGFEKWNSFNNMSIEYQFTKTPTEYRKEGWLAALQKEGDNESGVGVGTSFNPAPEPSK